MTEIRPDERLQEFMRRTLMNLRFVHEHRDVDGPYEVTQLVNSFLGALVHPWEKMQNSELKPFSQISLDEATALGLPVFSTTSGDEPQSYREMLRCIRNAYAHGNIEFVNHNGEITGILLENRPRPYWKGFASLRDMDDLLQTMNDFANGRMPDHKDFHLPLIAYAAD